ncbi:MAG: Rqc2 family fibronectin-binding protein [Atribacter sp.]|jgi:predicted ribosome quality control (RQC) complex YloA/Tae2 family protein|uniref:NFACT RNA-binding domain-containing protein n=1 Tax=Candidatus Atribacter allofermentans TaxID=1852833 RepID=A0A1V5SZR1_9BACT|nr:MAG: hypothetical protein BWY41_00762 [Candidatus Atribacteria bacterium ADurb.Bin276]
MRILEGIPLRFQIETVSPLVEGARVQKITLTENRETCLEIRSRNQPGFLVLSTHPEICFFYHSQQKPIMKKIKESAWVQILNKYLVGAKIIGFEQMGWDRVIRLTFQNQKIWEEKNLFYLYCELTGRNANCILTTADNPSYILGCQKIVGPQQNRFRTIVVGKPYQLPPLKINAIDPLLLVQEKAEFPIPKQDDDLPKWLLKNIDGVGPFLATIIAECLVNSRFNAGNLQLLLSTCLQNIFRPLFNQNLVFSVYISPQDNFPLGIFWLSTQHYAQLPHHDFPNLNEAVKYFAQTYWSLQAFLSQKNKKKSFIEKELLFIKEELLKVGQSLVSEDQLVELLTRGNLLKLYPQLNIIKKQPKGFLVANLLTGNSGEVFIEIDPLLSINQNMQLYFRKYRKSKTRNQILKKKKEELEFRKKILEKELINLDQAPLHQEQDDNNSTQSGFFEPGIIKFLTPSKNLILVGKNEKANHLLVTRFSSRDDYWLHVRDFPGSHVLLRISNQPERLTEDLFLAAQIAGYYSSLRNETSVIVMYTPIKNVKTLPHAGLGKMIFRNEKNLTVIPAIPDNLHRI